MIRTIQTMVMTAVVGLALAGTAAAQQPMPATLPVVMAPAAPQSAAPAAYAPAQAAPATAAAPVAAPVQPGCGCGAPAAPCGGCDSCKGSKWSGLHHGSYKTASYGCGSKTGCSSLASERTFLFGSCHSFYGGKCGFGFGNCASSPIGTGIVGVGPCGYGSYLNR
jgi:hypothetical protein